MDVIILAAGYATRLRPLTLERAKPLLPMGDRLIIDHLLTHIDRLDGVDCIHVVTNEKFSRHFEAWAMCRAGGRNIKVHNDGTTSNEDRLGAIGDIHYVIEKAGLAGELLVVAGDNLFNFDLRASQAFFRAKDASVANLYDFPDPALVPEYSEARLDADCVVTHFEEKPKDPRTNLIGICCYFFHPRDVARFGEYLTLFPREAGKSFDAPGYYMQWLHKQTRVCGYQFEGMWYDIGDIRSLTEADNLFRLGLGLPVRDIYAI